MVANGFHPLGRVGLGRPVVRVVQGIQEVDLFLGGSLGWLKCRHEQAPHSTAAERGRSAPELQDVEVGRLQTQFLRARCKALQQPLPLNARREDIVGSLVELDVVIKLAVAPLPKRLRHTVVLPHGLWRQGLPHPPVLPHEPPGVSPCSSSFSWASGP